MHFENVQRNENESYTDKNIEINKTEIKLNTIKKKLLKTFTMFKIVIYETLLKHKSLT